MDGEKIKRNYYNSCTFKNEKHDWYIVNDRYKKCKKCGDVFFFWTYVPDCHGRGDDFRQM